MSSQKPVCVVIGVGPGNGDAFARKFAAQGFAVALLARRPDFIRTLASDLPDARAFPCDVTDPAALDRTFAVLDAEMGPIDTVIYNAGKGVWGSALDISPDDFESSWKTNTYGAFLMSQRVVPGMIRRGRGNIVFIGATASRRGGAKTAAFASAKAAQRSLAESLARSLWPSGIHVSLIVVDGIIDEPLMRAKLPDKSPDFFVKPDDIAETALMLTRQQPSAWTFELEARPFGETW